MEKDVYQFTRKQLRWFIFLLLTTIVLFSMEFYRNYLYQIYFIATDKQEETTVKQKLAPKKRTITSISNIPGWSKGKYDSINIAVIEYAENKVIYTDGTLYDDVLRETPRPSSIFTDSTIKPDTKITVTWEAPIEANEKGMVSIVFDQKTKQVISKNCDYDM